MSILKALFGRRGGGEAEPGPAVTKTVEHKGFTVRAEPFKAGGQYQVAGWIEKEVGGELKRHRFIRADLAPSPDDAADTALQKGCRMIDEQGDGVFR